MDERISVLSVTEDNSTETKNIASAHPTLPAILPWESHHLLSPKSGRPGPSDWGLASLICHPMPLLALNPGSSFLGLGGSLGLGQV